MSLPPEILKKVRLIELNTRKLVNNLFMGEYHTAFKGQGMTFAEFREYVPGDDVRRISWNLTAKTGKPFIKKYEEERELVLMLVVDVSGSGDFGSGEYFKGEVMAYLASVLGFSAAKNNDQIGLVMFSDRIEHFVPPQKGRGHVHRILRDLLYVKPQSHGTDFNVAFDYVQSVLKKRATIFVMSDFIGEGYERKLRQIGKKHDCVALVVDDPIERKMPNLGLVELEDAETGEVVLVDTSDRLFQKLYAEEVENKRKMRAAELRKSQVDVVEIVNGPDFLDPLIKYFRRRHG